MSTHLSTIRIYQSPAALYRAARARVVVAAAHLWMGWWGCAASPGGWHPPPPPPPSRRFRPLGSLLCSAVAKPCPLSLPSLCRATIARLARSERGGTAASKKKTRAEATSKIGTRTQIKIGTRSRAGTPRFVIFFLIGREGQKTHTVSILPHTRAHAAPSLTRSVHLHRWEGFRASRAGGQERERDEPSRQGGWWQRENGEVL